MSLGEVRVSKRIRKSAVLHKKYALRGIWKHKSLPLGDTLSRRFDFVTRNHIYDTQKRANGGG